jgi:hypothetical protein
MEKLAHRDLLKSNPEYASLFTNILSSPLSDDERARIKELFDEAINKTRKRYYDKYPIIKSQSFFCRIPLAKR